MKLLELMSEETKQGTYAGVKFDKTTTDAILKYINDNNIPTGISSDKLHTTLLYSRKFLPDYKALGKINPPMVGKPGEFDVWETNGKSRGEASTRCLVLKFDCPELVKRHNYLMKEYEATYDFPEYKTHITLSYDIGDLNIDTLPDITTVLKEIIIVKEYQEALNLSWAKDHGVK